MRVSTYPEFQELIKRPGMLMQNLREVGDDAYSMTMFDYLGKAKDAGDISPGLYLQQSHSIYAHVKNEELRVKIAEKNIPQVFHHYLSYELTSSETYPHLALYSQGLEDFLGKISQLPEHRINMANVAKVATILIEQADNPLPDIVRLRDFSKNLYDRGHASLGDYLWSFTNYELLKTVDEEEHLSIMKPAMPDIIAALDGKQIARENSPMVEDHNKKIMDRVIELKTRTNGMVYRHVTDDILSDKVKREKETPEEILQAVHDFTGNLPDDCDEQILLREKGRGFILNAWKKGELSTLTVVQNLSSMLYQMEEGDTAPFRRAVLNMAKKLPENEAGHKITILGELMSEKDQISKVAAHRLINESLAYYKETGRMVDLDKEILPALTLLPTAMAARKMDEFFAIKAGHIESGRNNNNGWLTPLKKFSKIVPSHTQDMQKFVLPKVLAGLDDVHYDRDHSGVIREACDYFVKLPASMAGNTVELLKISRKLAENGAFSYEKYHETALELIKSLPKELKSASISDFKQSLPAIEEAQEISEEQSDNARLSILLAIKQDDKTVSRDEILRAAASIVGSSLQAEDGEIPGRLREIFKTCTGEEFRTNNVLVWTGANKRRDPAIAVFPDEGEPIVMIFNKRGRLSDVRQEITDVYPKGHARHAIFENFASRLG